jgi:hypothetical protein
MNPQGSMFKRAYNNYETSMYFLVISGLGGKLRVIPQNAHKKIK